MKKLFIWRRVLHDNFTGFSSPEIHELRGLEGFKDKVIAVALWGNAHYGIVFGIAETPEEILKKLLEDGAIYEDQLGEFKVD